MLYYTIIISLVVFTVKNLIEFYTNYKWSDLKRELTVNAAVFTHALLAKDQEIERLRAFNDHLNKKMTSYKENLARLTVESETETPVSETPINSH